MADDYNNDYNDAFRDNRQSNGGTLGGDAVPGYNVGANGLLDGSNQRGDGANSAKGYSQGGVGYKSSHDYGDQQLDSMGILANQQFISQNKGLQQGQLVNGDNHLTDQASASARETELQMLTEEKASYMASGATEEEADFLAAEAVQKQMSVLEGDNTYNDLGSDYVDIAHDYVDEDDEKQVVGSSDSGQGHDFDADQYKVDGGGPEPRHVDERRGSRLVPLQDQRDVLAQQDERQEHRQERVDENQEVLKTLRLAQRKVLKAKQRKQTIKQALGKLKTQLDAAKSDTAHKDVRASTDEVLKKVEQVRSMARVAKQKAHEARSAARRAWDQYKLKKAEAGSSARFIQANAAHNDVQ